MRINLFVFDSRQKKKRTVLINLYAIYYYSTNAGGILNTAQVKKKAVRTRRACIKIQTAKNLIKLQDV